MSKIVDKLIEAQKHAMSIRPKVGGFPILAEVLRQAGGSNEPLVLAVLPVGLCHE